MANQKKLLILVDGSERSMQTVQYVGQTKPFKKFKLVLFHVFSGVPECYWDMDRTDINREAISQLLGWETQQKKKIEGFMQKARAALLNEGFADDSIEIVIHKREVGIARDILKEVEQGNYTAVVLRRRGVGALEGLIVGSVANKLFSQLKSCPMVIAGQLPANQKLMLAIDGSPSSIKAVDFVAEHVNDRQYAIGLVHVLRGFGGLAPEEPDFMMPGEYVELEHNAMMRIFSDTREKLIKAGFDDGKIEERIVTGAYSRALAIVREAEAGGYNTIVAGRRGLSRVQGFFMGSVSSKIIHVGQKMTVWLV